MERKSSGSAKMILINGEGLNSLWELSVGGSYGRANKEEGKTMNIYMGEYLCSSLNNSIGKISPVTI